MRRRLSGWARFPVIDCHVERPRTGAEARRQIAAAPSAIARGNGRSYGDSSLNPTLTMEMASLDRLLAFDPQAGTVTAQGGMLLDELIDYLLPRGWFPAVTPGTAFVTLGGMIAADVHGKNHHQAGSIGQFVDHIELLVGDGQLVRCSRGDHPDLFAATCGGMGLTGIIVSASMRLIRVESARMMQRTARARDLQQVMELFENASSSTYSVAWIDCLASGKSLGRSVVTLADHAPASALPSAIRNAPLERSRRPRRSIPFDLPAWVLTKSSVAAFNQLYFQAHRDRDQLVGVDRYFYPLDAIGDWNRIYGRRGFAQFQCVIPLEQSAAGVQALLEEVSRSGGASFLAVLKRLGPAGDGLMSFPMAGYTLALDFPLAPGALELMERLDRIMLDFGGRLYLAKDSRSTGAAALANYPGLEKFREVRRRYGCTERFASAQSRRLGL